MLVEVHPLMIIVEAATSFLIFPKPLCPILVFDHPFILLGLHIKHPARRFFGLFRL